jgi:anti-anti-sigma factor
MADDSVHQYMIGSTEQAIWVRVSGAAQHANCVDFKKFLEDFFAAGVHSPRGNRPKDLHVALDQVDYIDSTFTGLLIWAAKLANAGSAAAFTLNRPSERCLEVLRIGGLVDFLPIVDENPPAGIAWYPLRHYKVDPLEKAVTILQMHETLAGLGPEQAARFSLVTKLFSAEVEKLREAAQKQSGMPDPDQ